MSWIMNPNGERQPTVEEDNEPKVEDYSGRKVSTKKANQPFLSYTNYRKKQEAEHDAWLKRKAERDEKIANGEKVGPEEPDPTAEVEVGLLGLLKFIVYTLIIIALAGKFVTGSFMWDYEEYLPALRQFLPSDQRLFSEEGLLKFDGTVEGKPLYLAIDGDVYDVTEGARIYGPGGSYHFMAGRDAARAFATGCFGTHRTHDIRGLDEKEMKGLLHWKNFFATHKRYKKVGRVIHHSIDPASPIPEHCLPDKASNDAKSTEDSKPASKPDTNHVEL